MYFKKLNAKLQLSETKFQLQPKCFLLWNLFKKKKKVIPNRYYLLQKHRRRDIPNIFPTCFLRSYDVGLPSGSHSKESAYSVWDWVRSLCGEDPLETDMAVATHSSLLAWGIPGQNSCLENSRPMPGQRSLAGYSPLGFKESDRIEWLHFHFPDTNAKICQKYKKENSKPIFLMVIEQKKKKKSLKNIRVWIQQYVNRIKYQD